MTPSAEPTVGIIANPVSGKDIRRLVAHGSSFDNNEKINIVRRALLGIAAAGVPRVAFMPDLYAIVGRAAAPLATGLRIEPLPMPTIGTAGDSEEAAKRLADLGAGVILTLGGDGTNRVVAKGCGEVPLVPVSTGTNNVFPRMIEGTLAGLAAGVVATGVVAMGDASGAIVRAPRLDVSVDGEPVDLALIDVVTARQAWVGARALWEPAHLREAVLSRIVPAAIGVASLGGLLYPNESGGECGAHLVIGDGDSDGGGDSARSIVAPLAPGLIKWVPIAASRLIAPGETVVPAPGPCTVALDGEREFELSRSDQRLSVTLNPRGPLVVAIEAALQTAAKAGVWTESPVL